MEWKKRYSLQGFWKALISPRSGDAPSTCAKALAARTAVLLFGILLMGLGAAGCISVMLGSDPVTAFIQGIGRTAGLGFGTAMTLFNLLTLCIVLLTDCRYIHLGTLFSTFLTGMFSGCFLRGLSWLSVHTFAFPLRMAVLLCSNFTVGIGLGMYQAADLGISPGDALNQMIARRLSLPLGKVRICYDLCMTIGAVLLGGIVHIGTLTGLLIVGPVMGRSYIRISRWLEGLF